MSNPQDLLGINQFAIRNKKFKKFKDDLTANHKVIRLHKRKIIIVYEEAGIDGFLDNSGHIQYGLFNRDNIPFLLIGIDNLQFDFVIDVYDLLPKNKRHILKKYKGDIRFVIVEPKTHRIVIERTFKFDRHFTVDLKSDLQIQKKCYADQFSVRNKIAELTQFLVTEEMFGCSKLYGG